MNRDPESQSMKLRLSPEDQRVLDALVDAGFDPQELEPLSERDRRRVQVVSHLFGLLDDYPVEDPDEALVDATLVRIERNEEERAARMSLEHRPDAATDGGGWLRIRLPDVITVAAVILIAVGVTWPLLTSMRQRSIDTACGNNLRLLGYAFGQYSNDFNGALPIATAGPSASWDTVRNALNLAPLVNGKYCEVGHLNCPGHKDFAGPSYSYRWFDPGWHIGWGTSRVTVVIGDLNPVIDAARFGRFVPPLSISLNHAGRGQNVLSSDGSTMWLVRPVVGQSDNIWLPNGAETLQPGALPTEPADVFLAH